MNQYSPNQTVTTNMCAKYYKSDTFEKEKNYESENVLRVTVIEEEKKRNSCRKDGL